MTNKKVKSNSLFDVFYCVMSQVCLLVLLMGISKVVSQKLQCDAESQVKMSIISALRHSLAVKNRLLEDLPAAIIDKESEVEKLKKILNTTSEEVPAIITALDNETTTDIVELETACEGLIALDCCHVSEHNNCK